MSDSVNRVIIIDDHPLFRKGAAHLVDMESSLKNIFEEILKFYLTI